MARNSGLSENLNVVPVFPPALFKGVWLEDAREEQLLAVVSPHQTEINLLGLIILL